MTTTNFDFLNRFINKNRDERQIEFAGQLAWFHHVIVGSVAVLVLVLAGMAGVLSFEAMKEQASTWSVKNPDLVPLVVDGTVIAGLLFILYTTLVRISKTAWLGWTLVIAGDGISILFNLIHGGWTWGQPFEVKHLMAVMPPVFLLITFEALTRMISYLLERMNTISAFHEMVETYHAVKAESDTQLTALKAEVKSLLSRKSEAEATVQELGVTLTDMRQKATAESEAMKAALMEQATAEVAEYRSIERAKAEQELDSINTQIGKLQAQKSALESEPKADLTDKEKRQIIVGFLWQNRDITGINSQSKVADLLGCSAKTVSVDLSELGLK